MVDPAPAGQEAPAAAPATGVGECTAKWMTISLSNRLLHVRITTEWQAVGEAVGGCCPFFCTLLGISLFGDCSSRAG